MEGRAGGGEGPGRGLAGRERLDTRDVAVTARGGERRGRRGPAPAPECRPRGRAALRVQGGPVAATRGAWDGRLVKDLEVGEWPAG